MFISQGKLIKYLKTLCFFTQNKNGFAKKLVSGIKTKRIKDALKSKKEKQVCKMKWHEIEK